MDFKVLEKLGVVSKDLFTKPLAPKTQATANTAGEVVEWDLPMDMLFYGVDLVNTSSVDGALLDKISQVTLTLDGSKPIRNLTGDMLKALALLRGKKPSTGYYPLNIVDEQLGTDPIYLKQFSSCKLSVTVAAGGSSIKNIVTPVLRLGARSSYGKQLSTSKLLVELMGTAKSYGTDTGDQEYEHQRGQNVAGYLYFMADNGSGSNGIFDTMSLQLFNDSGRQIVFEQLPVTVQRETNTNQAGGNALATGLVYVPFVPNLKTTDYSTIKSILHIPSAGTKAQVTVLERQVFG